MANSDSWSKKNSNSTDADIRSVMADPFIGFELDGTYQIVELLGAGGFGNVYRATHLTFGTDFAVKIVHKHHLQNDENLKRFEREAKLLSRIESPYIVKIVDHGFLPAPYIIMEYVDGIPLSKWLKTNGSMNSQMAIDLFLQLCEGLSAAEAVKVVHRDLKPANILLKSSGNKIQASILDFGLAKFVEQSIGAEKLTSTGDVLGSPPYMSPEQWKGNCDQRSDIYSLGCIMYEVMAGRPAFSAQYGVDYLNKHLSERPESISAVNQREKFPKALEDIVYKCMQKSPANRYQSSSACRADLKKVKIGRRPFIILAEEKTLVNTKWILCLAAFLTAVLGFAYLMREPILHSVCAQLINQADSKLAMGQSDDATAQYRQALFWSQMLPEKDMQKIRALRPLALLLKDRKELTAAESLEKQVRVLTGEASANPSLLLSLQKVDKSIANGDLLEAEKQCRGALELAGSSLGNHSMAYSTCLDLLGTIACKKGSLAEAIDCENKSLAIAAELLEPTATRKAKIMDHLSMALKAAGQVDESEKYAGLSLALTSSRTSNIGPPAKPPAVSNQISASSKSISSNAEGSKSSSERVPVIEANKHSNKIAVPVGNGADDRGRQSKMVELHPPINRAQSTNWHKLSVTTPAANKRPKPEQLKASGKNASRSTNSKAQIGVKAQDSSAGSGWSELAKLRSSK
jgi:hypothetical protein